MTAPRLVNAPTDENQSIKENAETANETPAF